KRDWPGSRLSRDELPRGHRCSGRLPRRGPDARRAGAARGAPAGMRTVSRVSDDVQAGGRARRKGQPSRDAPGSQTTSQRGPQRIRTVVRTWNQLRDWRTPFMKAVAVVPGKPHSVHRADLPKPSVDDIPGGRGVLVKVLRVGVDGTDKEINAAEYGAPPAGFDFLVIGHEGFG